MYREDAEKKKTMINEWTLSSGSSLSLSLNTDVYPKTYLAAFFDGESHYVIYQTVNGKICVWNVSSGKGITSSLYPSLLSLLSFTN